MRANKLESTNGLKWIEEGAKIFLKSPATMIAFNLSVSIIYLFILKMNLVGAIIKVISSQLIIFIAISIGRAIYSNNRKKFSISYEIIKKSYSVGIIYCLMCLIISSVSIIPFKEETKILIEGIDSFGTNQNDFYNALKLMFIPIFITSTSLLILNILFIFSTSIMIWNKAGLLKSIAFSSIAVWRNKFPFIVYLTTWLLIFLAEEILIVYIFKDATTPQNYLIVKTFTHTIISSVFYSSLYPIYKGIFENK